MKRCLIVIVVGLFIITMAMVSQGSAAELSKVGIVDLFRVLNESEAGKRAKADLEGIIKSKQGSIDEKGKIIERLKTDMEKQTAVLSPEARKAKEEEAERSIRDYQRMVTDSQAEVKKKESELTGSILKELRELISRMGQEEGYSLILESAEGLVLYYDKTNDLSDRVIKRYNESKAKAK